MSKKMSILRVKRKGFIIIKNSVIVTIYAVDSFKII